MKICHTQEMSHSRHRGKNSYTQNTEERHFTFEAQRENMSHAGDVTLKTQREEISHCKHQGKTFHNEGTKRKHVTLTLKTQREEISR